MFVPKNLFSQVHGSLSEKSPVRTYESEGEDDSSSSSVTGGTQTPPASQRLGIGNDNHSMKSHTPQSIKSEHNATANHTRSPSVASVVHPTNMGSHLGGNIPGSTLTCMPSTSPYGNSPNLPAPPPPPTIAAPFNPHTHHPNAHHLLYQHHPGNDWYQAAAVAAATTPTDPMNFNHFSHHQHHLMHHATAY